MIVIFTSGLQILASRVELGNGIDDSKIKIYFTGISDVIATPDPGTEGIMLRTKITNCFSDDHATVQMFYQVDQDKIESIEPSTK